MALDAFVRFKWRNSLKPRQWRKRKQRLKMQKASRRANRGKPSGRKSPQRKKRASR